MAMSAYVLRVVALLCCLLAVALYGTPALALDGNAWLRLSETARAHYVAGVVDTWFGAKDLSKGLEDGIPIYVPGGVELAFTRASDCIRGKPYSQVVAIVEKYMKDHPEKWHYDMTSSIFVAVYKTCQQ